MCKAAISDDHPTHILEHKNVIADPGLRLANDPKAGQIVNNALTHIAEHEQLMMQCIKTRPILAGVLKLTPQGPAAPPPQGGAKPPMPQQKKPLPPGANTRPPIKPVPQPGAPLHAQGPMLKRKVPTKGGMNPTVAVPPPTTNSAPQGAVRA